MNTLALTFVPCVEDADYTREVGRHPAAFQRTLDAASYRFLVASSRLATDPASPALRTAFEQTLTASCACLWRQRATVPRPARREWFETVMVHLHALGKLEAGLLWLLDHPSEHTSAAPAEAGPSSSSSSSPEAAGAVSSGGAERKAPKAKKAAADAVPMWYLWQDTQRHLHHLTLRLHSWTPVGGGAYAAREAVRPSDLVRMDSAAFTWRVRQWSRVACVVLANPSEEPLGELSSVLATHAAVFAETEPELARLLSVLASPAPSPSAAIVANSEDGGVVQRREVAGALLFRVLLETMVVRLRALPRCMFTWRLLRDTLHSVAATCAVPTSTAAALTAMSNFVDTILLPYLEQRDCHIGNMRHTASSIQAHFTQLATKRIGALHATVAAAHGENSLDSPRLPATWDNDDQLALEHRLDMSAAMCHLLRQVCCCDGAAAASASVVGATILASDDDDAELRQDVVNAAAPVALETVAAVVRDVHHRRVEERLFFSDKCRTLHLTVFFLHYFTQPPTLAFDRVSRGAATDASSMTADGANES